MLELSALTAFLPPFDFFPPSLGGAVCILAVLSACQPHGIYAGSCPKGDVWGLQHSGGVSALLPFLGGSEIPKAAWLCSPVSCMQITLVHPKCGDVVVCSEVLGMWQLGKLQSQRAS